MSFERQQYLLDFFNLEDVETPENIIPISTHLTQVRLQYISNQQLLSSAYVGQSVRIKCFKISLLKNGKKEIIHKFLTVGERNICYMQKVLAFTYLNSFIQKSICFCISYVFDQVMNTIPCCIVTCLCLFKNLFGRVPITKHTTTIKRTGEEDFGGDAHVSAESC